MSSESVASLAKRLLLACGLSGGGASARSSALVNVNTATRLTNTATRRRVAGVAFWVCCLEAVLELRRGVLTAFTRKKLSYPKQGPITSFGPLLIHHRLMGMGAGK